MRSGFMNYLVRRIGFSLILVFGITLITFILTHVVPSDPAASYAGLHPKPEQIAQARKILGLDRPIYVQYFIFLKGLVSGNWGVSLRTHQPVLLDLWTYFPSTLELVIGATLLSVVIGIPAGVYASVRRDGAVDTLVRLWSGALLSIPAFWLSLLLQIVFFGHLHLLPLGGQVANQISYNLKVITGFPLLDALLSGGGVAFGSELVHLVLPSFALAAYPIGLVARMTRGTMLEVLNSDFIKMAVANGYRTTSILFRYALKNAFGAVLTALGLVFAFSLTGDFFIELIFYWQGLGTYAVNSIQFLDTPAILGVVILVATAYVVVNLVVDIVRAYLDPRISLD